MLFHNELKPVPADTMFISFSLRMIVSRVLLLIVFIIVIVCFVSRGTVNNLFFVVCPRSDCCLSFLFNLMFVKVSLFSFDDAKVRRFLDVCLAIRENATDKL